MVIWQLRKIPFYSKFWFSYFLSHQVQCNTNFANWTEAIPPSFLWKRICLSSKKLELDVNNSTITLLTPTNYFDIIHCHPYSKTEYKNQVTYSDTFSQTVSPCTMQDRELINLTLKYKLPFEIGRLNAYYQNQCHYSSTIHAGGPFSLRSFLFWKNELIQFKNILLKKSILFDTLELSHVHPSCEFVEQNERSTNWHLSPLSLHDYKMFHYLQGYTSTRLRLKAVTPALASYSVET